MARIALAKDHGFEVDFQSPMYQSKEVFEGGILLTFNHVSDGGLRAFDTKELKGFVIAGDEFGLRLKLSVSTK